MIRLLVIATAALLGCQTWAAGEVLLSSGAKDAEAQKLPAVSLLPAGSTLKKVMLPRYNVKKQLVGVLRSDLMTIIDNKTVRGTNVLVEMFRPEDGGKRGQIALKTALYQQDKNFIRAEEPVTVDTDELRATGSGMVYSITKGQGFLSGPVTTEFRIHKKTKP